MADKPFKVLIIDDEPLLKNIIEQKFRFQIKNNQLLFLYASNGNEALEILDANPDIGVLFTDLNMPGMDGLTLLRQLHTQKSSRLYRPVVISAYGDMTNVRAAMNCGATDFITKPIDIRDLEATLMKTIDQYLYIQQGVLAQERMVEIQKEINIAKEIQHAYMSYNFTPFDNPQIVLYGEGLVDREKIGGDFFDFFSVDNQRLAFILTDLPEEGIPAAMRMLMLRTLFRSAALKAANALECIRNVNHNVCEEEYSKHSHVSAFYGMLDVNNGILNYCIAGTVMVYVVTMDGNVLSLGQVEAGPPLGKIDEMERKTSLFYNSSFALQPGDLLFLCTLSGIEATNERSEMYTETRLINQLLANPNRSPEQFIKDIKSNIQSFSAGGKMSNITFFSVSYQGNSAAPESPSEQG